MPYHTPADLTYDSGDFMRLMDAAMARADWGAFETRRTEAKARGRLRGIGMAYYIEGCAGFSDEHARLRLDPDGGLSLFIGTMSNGQGHATVYMQILHDRFGVAPDLIRVRQGDTAELADGWGTGGSRSLLIGGMAAEGAADRVIARAREIAGHLLEASEADLELADGAFTVAGADRRIGLAEIARAANGPPGDTTAQRLPDALRRPIDEHARYEPDSMTYPNGCHICELEADAATGQVRIARYLVVDDFGKVVNPALCIGQVHGGAVQGIGQALTEHTVYEAHSGQLLSGSLMDYCLPRADDVPDLEVTLVEDFPCTTNPMGVKGAGEAGAIGAPPALINALLDALAPLGVRHIDMPATPERVWRAIRQAEIGI
jgi:carbon-monoxide dehydrogenase large subunit